MEKTNKKSKSSLIVLSVAVLLCAAIVLGMGGFTFAKYISSKSAETQTASVAKWGYVISADSTDLFGTKYDENGAVIKSADGSASIGVAASASNSAIVAPGTGGSMTFSVTGSAEVRSKITVEATGDTVTLETGTEDSKTTYEPIKWTLTDNNDTKKTTTYKSHAKAIEALNGLAAGYQNIAPNTNLDDKFSYTLSWAWAFEDSSNEDSSNLCDTILGAIMNGTDTTDKDGNDITVDGSAATVKNVAYTATTSVSLGLKITVEQIQDAGGDSTLAAGLYDKDYALLAAYATSGMDVTTNYTDKNYQSELSSPYYILNNTYTDTVHIVLPDGITDIGKFAFHSCSSLESVTIPDSVTAIGDNAFGGCSALKSITVPGSVLSISSNAFSGCSALTNVTIKSGVVSIQTDVFNNCTSLASITIPESVMNIGNYAFNGCSALTSVYYTGTDEASWNKIHIYNTNSELTQQATIYYYSETKPTEGGNYWHYDTDGVTPVVWE